MTDVTEVKDKVTAKMAIMVVVDKVVVSKV